VTSATLTSAADKIEALAQRGVGLVVLPELFCFDANLQAAAEAAADDFLTVIRTLARACMNTGTHVVTSLVETVSGELTHVGVLIGQAGIVARQVQLHVPPRHSWARAGRRIENICMPWGNLAIAVGEDALMPELAHTYATLGTTLLAVPMSSRFHAHARVILPALADQLQCAVVAALRPERAADEEDRAASLIADPQRGALTKALAVDGVCSAAVAVRRPIESRSARRSPSAYRAAI
jgi:predicted amidohydrolase